jgi:hypothetical protein
MAVTDEAEEECESNGLSSASNQPKKKQKRKTYARGVYGLNDSLSHMYADPTQIAPTDAAELLATRSRAGRKSTPRQFLSYNHHDPNSVTMLTCFKFFF